MSSSAKGPHIGESLNQTSQHHENKDTNKSRSTNPIQERFPAPKNREEQKDSSAWPEKTNKKLSPKPKFTTTRQKATQEILHVLLSLLSIATSIILLSYSSPVSQLLFELALGLSFWIFSFIFLLSGVEARLGFSSLIPGPLLFAIALYALPSEFTLAETFDQTDTAFLLAHSFFLTLSGFMQGLVFTCKLPFALDGLIIKLALCLRAWSNRHPHNRKLARFLALPRLGRLRRHKKAQARLKGT